MHWHYYIGSNKLTIPNRTVEGFFFSSCEMIITTMINEFKRNFIACSKTEVHLLALIFQVIHLYHREKFFFFKYKTEWHTADKNRTAPESPMAGQRKHYYTDSEDPRMRYRSISNQCRADDLCYLGTDSPLDVAISVSSPKQPSGHQQPPRWLHCDYELHYAAMQTMLEGVSEVGNPPISVLLAGSSSHGDNALCGVCIMHITWSLPVIRLFA